MKMFIACFLASFGFALIFNIPRDKAFYAGLTGGIGGIVYHLCLNMNLQSLFCLILGQIPDKSRNSVYLLIGQGVDGIENLIFGAGGILCGKNIAFAFLQPLLIDVKHIFNQKKNPLRGSYLSVQDF